MDQIENLIRELGFNNIKDAAKKHAHLIILSRISKYEAEYNIYKQKYGCEYIEFAEKLSGQKNTENFECEDDLLDWRFSFEQIRNYKNKLTALAA